MAWEGWEKKREIIKIVLFRILEGKIGKRDA